MLRNNYRSRNLIGHYPFWVISPRNSTLFTKPFLTGRRARAGHKTRPSLALFPGHSQILSHSHFLHSCGIIKILAWNGLGARLGHHYLHTNTYSMRYQSPSPGHPSAADEAWYWPNASCAVGDFIQQLLRKMWFVDCSCIVSTRGST